MTFFVSSPSFRLRFVRLLSSLQSMALQKKTMNKRNYYKVKYCLEQLRLQKANRHKDAVITSGVGAVASS